MSSATLDSGATDAPPPASAPARLSAQPDGRALLTPPLSAVEFGKRLDRAIADYARAGSNAARPKGTE